MAKLEVYTVGIAASHFNSTYRQLDVVAEFGYWFEVELSGIGFLGAEVGAGSASLSLLG